MSENSLIPSRRQLVLGGAMLATAGIAWLRTPRIREVAIGPDQIEKAIPKKIGSWTFESEAGLVLPPPDALSAQLYDQQLTRVYSSPNEESVMLLIAYGSSQSGMLQVHRPEICYPASGYAMSNEQIGSVGGPYKDEIAVRKFTASRGPRVERLLYWIRVGQEFTVDWTNQRLAVMKANLRGIVPDGALVRLSVVGLDDRRADEVLQRFAAEMMAQSPAAGRRLLVGGNEGRAAGQA